MSPVSGVPPAGEAGRAARPRSRLPWRLVAFGAVALVSVHAGFVLPDVEQARALVQGWGYYTIAGTFIWALVALARLVPAWGAGAAGKLDRGEWLRLAPVLVLLTAVAVFTVPYTYKVLYDEFVLQSTALHLHQAREVGASVRAYEVEGTFRSLGTYLDKRPFFFAFLVSLVHDLTGYRELNAFVFNTVLLPVILLLAYGLGRALAGRTGGLVTAVGFGAHSLLALNATGAGMEMLNLAMLLAVMLLAVHYLAQPAEDRLGALVLAAVLLAQTRYESGLYIAPVALVILEGWRRAGRVILPAAALAAPALLVPYALHQTYLSGSPQLWELREGEAARFGVPYFAANLEHALRYFFNFTGSTPNSWWLAVAGVPATAWALARAGRGLAAWRRAEPAVAAVAVFGAAIAANLGLLMFYYWGQLDDPIVSRLSLPFSLLLALLIAWAAVSVPPAWRGRAVALALGGALLSYASSGLRANATHGDLNLLMREIAWEGEVVAALPPVPRLVLSNKSGLYWILRETASIPLARARWRADAVKFHLDHHTFREVLVTQNYLPASLDGTFQLDPKDRLPDSYVLEPVAERRFDTHFARVSRVKEIRLDAGRPETQAAAAP